MKLRPTALVSLLPILAACTIVTESTSDGGPDTGAASDDGGAGTDSGTSFETGTGTDGGADAQTALLGFTPSNIDLAGLDLSKVGDVIISGANNGILDTESLTWSCCNQPQFAAKTITFPDQSKMSVFVVKSLRVEASSLLDVRAGHIPVAIVSLSTITLFGNVKVSPGSAGGAFNTLSATKGSGPGGGLSGPASSLAAAGGASFCGIGGAGSTEMGGTAYGKAAAYGTPELIPLVAGSAGGVGAIASNGQGGGAVQLVAATSIDLKAGAFISAPGGKGGQGGLATMQEGSGGGSGGAILLEAPTVTIAGALTANGGGGGSGGAWGGKDGDDGHDSDANPAAGGKPAGPDGGQMTDHGGNGGAGPTPDGTDGVNSIGSGAGGGGGAGRIRINTMSGQANVTGATLSPAAMMSCFTQGMLKK